jgi:hypothetical protein
VKAVNEERNPGPAVGVPFGVQVEITGHLDAKGRFIEDGVWINGQGDLPAGTRPRRVRIKPNQEMTDARGS